jgi:16S rRNA processing protein RimM
MEEIFKEKHMAEERYFVVGEIVNTQGIKGEVRVIPHTDDITRFELLDTILIDKKGRLEEYEIENVRYHKQFVLLKFKGVDDMTAAEKLKTFKLKVPESQALPLEEGE